MMEEHIIQTAKEVSIKAILKAGQLAKEHFDNVTDIEEKDSFGM